MNHSHEPSGQPRRDPRFNFVLLAFLGIAAFFLLSEHRAHALGVLPFALLLLCPLLHLFMHGDHAGHGRDQQQRHGGAHDDASYERRES